MLTAACNTAIRAARSLLTSVPSPTFTELARASGLTEVEIWRWFQHGQPEMGLPPDQSEALEQLHKSKRLEKSDKLKKFKNVFRAAGPPQTEAACVGLCKALEHLRDIAAHHALDRQNDLRLQEEVARYRDLALAIKALGITGDPPRVHGQMHEHLVTAIEEVAHTGSDTEWLASLVTTPDKAEEADIAKEWLAPVVAAIDKAGLPALGANLRLRELLEHLVRDAAVFRAAASQIERGLAKGDLQWLPGRAVYPPPLLESIEDIWRDVLRRSPAKPKISVNAGRAGPFLRFAVACLELLSLPATPATPAAVRSAILRDRERRGSA
jgi:hypothetical protein